MPATIEIKDAALMSALTHAHEALSTGITGLLKEIGEDMVTRINQRFATSTGPDGERWPENSRVTMLRFLAAKGGFGKSGSLNQKGRAHASAKKPLIGLTQALATSTAYQMADATTVEIRSTRPYAAVQQFGAKEGEFGRYSQVARWRDASLPEWRRRAGSQKGFPIPWGNIPPRRFMPLTAGGNNITAAECTLILAQIGTYLSNAFDR